MGHYEDLFWEVDKEIKEKGLQKEFNAQLKKMETQNKHQFKDARERWSYAYDKVVRKYSEKNG